ncbi:MAG: SPOR domain-containing protein [Gammaproteobacteria bacterium]|nr:SPOR domain-containing protein [Gammaproteobacteria bacterium]
MPAQENESIIQTSLVEEGAVKLVMLKESAETQVTAQAQPKSWCYGLGPFKTDSSVNLIETKLLELGFPVTFYRSTEAKKKGYWVLLPPHNDISAAKQVASTLKKKHKIKDLFIVTTGEKKNGISLGVFSKFELAYRRQNDINELGFSAVVEEVQLPSKAFWLEWPRGFDKPVPEALMIEVKALRDSVSKIEKECGKG